MRARRTGAWANLLALASVTFLPACNSSNDADGSGVRSRSLRAVTGSGIAECDSYLTAYESCINSVVSDSADRATALQGLEKTKSDWAQMATSATERAALARMCVQAERALSEESCTWSPIGGGPSGGAGGTGGSSGSGGTGGSGGAGGTGGTSGTGGAAGSSCTFQSAQQVSTNTGVAVTLPANACFKINTAPAGWGPKGIKLQPMDGGNATYPLGFTYFQNSGSSCETAGSPGSGTLTADWVQTTVPPSGAFTAGGCAVVFSFSGSANQTQQFTYYYP